MRSFLSESKGPRDWRSVRVEGMSILVPRWPATQPPSAILWANGVADDPEGRRRLARIMRRGVQLGILHRREFSGGGCKWPEIGEATP